MDPEITRQTSKMSSFSLKPLFLLFNFPITYAQHKILFFLPMVENRPQRLKALHMHFINLNLLKYLHSNLFIVIVSFYTFYLPFVCLANVIS